MMAILKKRQESDDQFNQYLRQCRASFDSLLRVQLDFTDAVFGMNEVNIHKWLKSKGLNFKKRFKIVSRRRQFSVSIHFSQWISLFKEALNLEKELKEEKKIFNKGQEILRQISNMRSNFWRSWIELAVALNTSNHAWARQQVAKIIKTGPYEVFFHAPLNFEKRMEIEIIELFSLAIQRFKKKIKNEMLSRILIDELNQLGNSIEFRSFSGRFNSDWSLAELRGMSKKELFVRKYFDFWYSKYFNRTAEVELRSFLREVLTPRTLKKALVSQLWVFAYYLPSDQKLRKILSEKLVKAWRSKDMYKKFVVIRLLGQKPIKRALQKEIPEFSKARFQIERNYFRKLLDSGVAVHFALYHLMRLGDKDRENLWWLVI